MESIPFNKGCAEEAYGWGRFKMQFKTLEINDIVARPDLAASSGCVLHAVIPVGVNPRLVPLKHILKQFGPDYSYLSPERYPVACSITSGLYSTPSMAVIGKLNDDYTITLNELPQ